MKKFNWIPAALALVSLASCSDNELFTNTNGETVDGVNSIAVTTELVGVGDVTRSMVESYASHYHGAYRVVWEQNTDQLRVYDNTVSAYDVYKYSGANLASNIDATKWVVDDANPQLNGQFTLAAFPSSWVKSASRSMANKDYTELQMSIPANFNYAEGTGANAIQAGDINAYAGNLPMYGKCDAGDGEVKLNFLTAMVKIAMKDLPATAKSVTLESVPTWTGKDYAGGNYSAYTTEQKAYAQVLTGRFQAEVQRVAGETPVLKPVEDLRATYGRKITVDLTGKFTADADTTSLWLPIPAEQAYEQLKVSTWTAANGTGTETVIATRENWAPTRNRIWEVMYTSTYMLDTDPLTGLYPGDITNVLNQESDAIGTLVIKPYSKTGIAVKALNPKAGDVYYHQITVPNMVNNANITLDMSYKGILYGEALQIYEKEGEDFTGTFTIIPSAIETGSTATSKIEVNLPNADVVILGTGLGNIDIQSAKSITIGDDQGTTTNMTGYTLTVQDGTAVIKKNANIATVIAQAYAGDPTQHAEKITVEGGATVTTLNNNTKCDIELIGETTNEALITTLNCSGVTEEINITSTGKAAIGDLKTNTTAGSENLCKLNITSTLGLQATGVNATASTLGTYNTNTDGVNYIYTAAQLVNAATANYAANTVIVADEIDLNGTECVWTGGNLANNLTGYNADATASYAWKATTVKDATKTHKNVIKNMKLAAVAGNGLVKNITAAATIGGLEFVNPSFTSTTAVDNIGVLAGTITPAATATIAISNVKVSGLDVSSKAGNGVGGLIGKVDGTTAKPTVNIMNADVASTAIKARSFVGGLVGRVIGTNGADFNIYDSQANLSNLELLLADGVTTLYPVYAGTWGAFIGGTEANPTVALNIYDSSYGTAISKATKGNGINNQGLRFGANADANDVPFFGGNPWIGFCGIATGTSNTTLTTFKSVSTAAADKGKNFYKYAYGAASMTVTRWNGAGNYAETTPKALDGGALKVGATTVGANSVTYDGTNAAGVAASKAPGNFAWKSGFKYGTTIYSIYDTSALDPDALGYTTYEPTSF